jgi:hypothetical protein
MPRVDVDEQLLGLGVEIRGGVSSRVREGAAVLAILDDETRSRGRKCAAPIGVLRPLSAGGR